MDEVENYFCQFPNPWALRVSGMGGYTSKCEKKSKSLDPTTPQLQTFCPLQSIYYLKSKILYTGEYMQILEYLNSSGQLC